MRAALNTAHKYDRERQDEHESYDAGDIHQILRWQLRIAIRSQDRRRVGTLAHRLVHVARPVFSYRVPSGVPQIRGSQDSGFSMKTPLIFATPTGTCASGRHGHHLGNQPANSVLPNPRRTLHLSAGARPVDRRGSADIEAVGTRISVRKNSKVRGAALAV